MILEGSHNKTGTVCKHWNKSSAMQEAIFWQVLILVRGWGYSGRLFSLFVVFLPHLHPVMLFKWCWENSCLLPPCPAKSWAFSSAPGRQHCLPAAPLCCSASPATLQRPVGTQNLVTNSLLQPNREDAPKHRWYLPISASKSWAYVCIFLMYIINIYQKLFCSSLELGKDTSKEVESYLLLVAKPT